MLVDDKYNYMPKGSYAVLPGGDVVFLQELPAELKERFRAHAAQEEQKMQEAMRDPDAIVF